MRKKKVNPVEKSEPPVRKAPVKKPQPEPVKGDGMKRPKDDLFGRPLQ
jgi:hypothetical protein